jgi:hypothetical protein
MEKIFGKNWQTTLWGGIMVICTTISLNPLSIEFLPDSLEYWIKGIAGFIALVSGLTFVSKTKDKDVTGVGTHAETLQEVQEKDI